MSAPDALLEVLRILKKEAADLPVAVPCESWSAYRQRQEMWNPNYARAAEVFNGG